VVALLPSTHTDAGSSNVARKRNFSVDREPIELVLGGETFHAPAVIAPAALGELLDAQAEVGDLLKIKELTQGEQIKQVLKLLDAVFRGILVPESSERFSKRLHSRDNPFDLMREVMPAVEWLVEEYSSDRPTQPSSPSGTGSNDGGANSTAGAPPAAWTPAISPPTGSSTSPTT
jgi:hypothetical protein